MNALTISFDGNAAALRIDVAGLTLVSSLIPSPANAGAQEEPLRARQDVSGGAVVIDRTTGLMWDSATTAESKTWPEADAAAKACRLGGYDDWRLPTLDELESIRDITRHNPAINISLFPNTKSTYFWASSAGASGPADFAWLVGFNCGDASIDRRSYRCCVRAVRSSRASQ